MKRYWILILLILPMFYSNAGDERSMEQGASEIAGMQPSCGIPEDSTDKSKKSIQYSDYQLEKYLDSIGNLPSGPLMEKVSLMVDSIFKNQQQLDIVVEASDFEKLKQGCNAEQLDVKTVKAIFGDIHIDERFIEKGVVPLTFFSFDENKNNFKEFAVCPGYADATWNCDVYFFSGNKMIAKHHIYHRFGLELEHYKDIDGKTIVYYKESLLNGTGTWWYNFYFYKYYDNKLIPILNELQNANLQIPWSVRLYWFQSTVQNTHPLTLKMVYNQAYTDSLDAPYYIDDSTFVQYRWDEETKRLIGDYEKSKISKAQIMSYYLEDNELLFINAYNELIKKNLKDSTFRQSTLNYLNFIKNYYENIIR